MRSLFFVFIVVFTGHITAAQEYKYLVLKGGGIRGIAYTGALKVLEDQKITQGIEKVAGTSVGSMIGALFCVGYTASQMDSLMLHLNVAAFNDGGWSVLGGHRRIKKNYGWYKGRKLEQWVGKQIAAQTGSENTTFMQLHKLTKTNKKYKDLYVPATNLATQQTETFSWETYPDMPIKYAVKASSAVPLYFAAVLTDDTGKIITHPNKYGHYNVYVDGGLLANYPITIFNTQIDNISGRINEHTLGLKLDRPEQIEYYKTNNTGLAPYDIHSFRNYTAALYNVTIEQLNKKLPYNEEKKHTIYISTSNLSPKVRHITMEQKKLLSGNGQQGALEFLKKYPPIAK